MSIRTSVGNVISRNPFTAALSLITLTAGIAFVLRAPTTGLAPSGAHIQEFQTGSGAQVGYINDLGQMNLSGSLTVQGVKIGTGQVTLADGDVRYVNVSGDTMTGSLTVNGTASGQTAAFGGGQLNVTSTGSIDWQRGGAGIVCIQTGKTLGICAAGSVVEDGCDCVAP